MLSGRRGVVASVMFADLELWLVGWLRGRLAARPEPICAGVTVNNKEPTGEFPAKLVVVREDGITRTGLVTGEASIGVTVFAGTKSLPQPANELVRMVRAIIEDCPGAEPGNPVAAVVDSTGPFAIPEDGPSARRYLTFNLAVVGVPLAAV